MKFRKISKFLAVTLIFSTSISFKTYAFQPASHCSLIEKVKVDLPEQSIIKRSLEIYPGIANWGSVALDLGYLQPGQILDRAPWADRYHYYKVGTFASEQLKIALSSRDMKKIAFATGWISHITGDLSCHGIFVNTECGVYLDNENTRALHKELENNAEAVVWADIAKKSIADYKNGISSIFSNIDEIPFGLVNEVSEKVYGVSQTLAEEKLQCNTLIAGLKTGIGYNYGDLQKSREFLAQNGRSERLKNAFTDAENNCTSLLIAAENGDFSKFSDRWNLDVGKSKSPISSLTAVVETGEKFGAGTDDDVFLDIQLKNGKTKEWKLDKNNYNDFEQGDNDEYYLYINDIDFSPNDVKKVIVKKKKANISYGADWYLKTITVNVNGTDALKQTVNSWVQGDNASKEFIVDWSNIKNTSDPE
ncbi:PLAT/LH2 domain-containing protein [Clostridium estertheticum]|uniref:PLAT/LH2 domain-containing protein n=1 Tax=Clostridium estertheticum TaxID=238834 RepID=UPI001478A874|nr:PLAT/LH2 domain-containing protein [Clostridium estertheticum]MBZ9618531.1 zinc dependent phospholipase C family protein [Clostridium estertheticum subsp. laramiense]WAG76457.1 zinc dependent phospholipase C family protein [Clostridium estertheticum]